MKEGEILFKKNRVDLQSKEKIEKERQLAKDLSDISQLQPNKKFLGLFKTRLWFYNVADRRKPNKFRYWMKNKVGEAPVLYDSLLVSKSAALMQNYLINKGFFYAEVTHETKIKKKKAIVTYHAEAKDLYRINKVIYPDVTSRIDSIIDRNKEDAYLKSGDPFDVSVLKEERERISDNLRNEGYYYFNKEYVYFDLDSNNRRNELDIFVRINPPGDSAMHEVYYINNVFVYTDFAIEQLKETTISRDTVNVGEYYFISEELKYRPKVLISAIHFEHDDLFKKSDYTSTINHLTDLGVFKYVSVKFRESNTIEGNYLDCIIYLSPAKKQEIGIEFEANNNTDYNLGVALTLSYRNKNIFKGTELFQFSLSGGFESNLERGVNFFNTLDIVGKFDLYFNQFIVPFRLKNVSKDARPKTHISFRNEYLRRIEYYTSNSTTLSFGYDWRDGITRRHILDPLVVNYVRIFNSTEEFDKIVNRSPSLKSSFTNQLILGAEYNFIWTNQAIKKGRSFAYYTGKVSIAGNFLYLISTLSHLKSNEGPPYEVFGVQYSQYFLVDSDIRNYLKLRKNNRFVTRLYGGIGVPYGNSSSLTYIKQFFAGGANSLRAWRIRAIGPGAFNFEKTIGEEEETFFFDQTGDIKLEGNAEFRFDVFKFIKGAFFLDVGNVWLLKADTARPEAHFDFSEFWTQFAIGAGVGVRLDFKYFVFRFDTGFKIRNPASGKETWPIRNFDITDKAWRKENIRLNLAIGYPF